MTSPIAIRPAAQDIGVHIRITTRQRSPKKKNHHKRPIYFLIIGAAGLLLLNGCAHWHGNAGPPKRDLAEVDTYTVDGDVASGMDTASVVLSTDNVTVDGRRLTSYEVGYSFDGEKTYWTESANGDVITSRALDGAFDLELAFFGESGCVVFLSRDPLELRIVEPLEDSLRMRVVTRATGESILLDDGSGPYNSWEKRIELSGVDAVVEDSIRKTANAKLYYQALLQEDTPMAKYIRVRLSTSRGIVPELSNDNILVRGPGGLVRFLSIFLPAQEENIVDALSSISDNLRHLNSRLSEVEDERLQEIYKEIVAKKVFKLIRCIEAGGILGNINGDAFDECVDELDDLGEAIDETPDGQKSCEDLCSNPEFDIERCKEDHENTFNEYDIIDEVCDVYRYFRPEIEGSDDSEGAQKFIDEIEENIRTLAERIWGKMRAYCKCE